MVHYTIFSVASLLSNAFALPSPRNECANNLFLCFSALDARMSVTGECSLCSSNMKLTSRMPESRADLLRNFEKFYGFALRIGDARPSVSSPCANVRLSNGGFGRGYAFVNE